ncbi:DUF1851 domain-containing protein [Leucothrix sargassi]|nr:DUF1851 domain-containing protein [Leucothrix sargassi]
MDILKEVKAAWAWSGIEPVEVVTENDFGNLILKDANDYFWRLCPEDVYCDVIAKSIEEYNALIEDEEFVDDWFMDSMVAEAKKKLGELDANRKYYMVTPAILGGEYEGKNFKITTLAKSIRFSGELGKQVQDLSDGAEVQIKDTR